MKTKITILVLGVAILLILVNFLINSTKLETIKFDRAFIPSLPASVERNESSYAYKELTGQESSYFHEKYLEVAEEEGFTLDDYNAMTEEEKILAIHENSDSGLGMVKDTTLTTEGTIANHLIINNMFDGLFRGIRYDPTVIDVAKESRLTSQDKYTSFYVEELQEGIERFLRGTFEWNYRNEANLDDFLGFRVGNYFYEEKVVNTKEQYDLMHNKVKENSLIITLAYDPDQTHIYIHPQRGGFILDTDLTLVFSRSCEVTGIADKVEYTFNYRGEFNFKSPSPIDIWPLWTTNKRGVLIFTGSYVSSDIERGE